MEKLKKELAQVDKDFDDTKKKRFKLIKKIQKICKHTRIRKSGGGSWSEWPDYGTYDICYRCLDCGKSWRKDAVEPDFRYKIENFVVEDVSG